MNVTLSNMQWNLTFMLKAVLHFILHYQVHFDSMGDITHKQVNFAPVLHYVLLITALPLGLGTILGDMNIE